MTTDPEFIKQLALSKAAAQAVASKNLTKLSEVVAQGLNVNLRYDAFDVVLVRNLQCLEVLGPHMSQKVLSMSLKSNLEHYDNLVYLVTLVNEHWVMTKAMNSCITKCYYNRAAFNLFVENGAYANHRSFTNCCEMGSSQSYQQEILETLCELECIDEERCAAAVVNGGHVWAAMIMRDCGYNFHDNSFHLLETAISNRDIPMIEFLCSDASEFESEALRTLSEIDDNEIDDETGCPISILILDVLHKYEMRIDSCYFPNLSPAQQAYVCKNNLKYDELL